MNIEPGDLLLANPLDTAVDVLEVSVKGVLVAQLAYGGEPFLVPWDKIGPEPDRWRHQSVRR